MAKPSITAVRRNVVFRRPVSDNRDAIPIWPAVGYWKTGRSQIADDIEDDPNTISSEGTTTLALCLASR